MARGVAKKKKKKSNQNTWVFFIIVFLLFQLGKFGHRNDWFTQKSKIDTNQKNIDKTVYELNEKIKSFNKNKNESKKIDRKKLKIIDK